MHSDDQPEPAISSTARAERRANYLAVVQFGLFSRLLVEIRGPAVSDDPSFGLAEHFAAAVSQSRQLSEACSAETAALDFLRALPSPSFPSGRETEQTAPSWRMAAKDDMARIADFIHRNPGCRGNPISRLVPHLTDYQRGWLLDELCRQRKIHRVDKVWLHPGPSSD